MTGALHGVVFADVFTGLGSALVRWDVHLAGLNARPQVCSYGGDLCAYADVCRRSGLALARRCGHAAGICARMQMCADGRA